jgi:uncharacterized protein (TIGR00251 family)
MLIEVKAITNAKKDEIISLGNNKFKIKVTDIPAKNKANKKITKILSKYMSVSKSEIILLKGQKNSNKVFSVKNDR